MARLETLLKDIRACRICRDNPEGLALQHEPRPVLQASSSARLLIAGQAPGTLVHESGRPFTDPSGKRLREWLDVDEEIFYDENRIAIVPMGFCFPGQDRRGSDLPPRPECARAWRSKLMAGLPQIELILIIGQYAQAWHLGGLRKATLTETVFHWREAFDELTPPVIPLPHPSWRNNTWLSDNPWFEHEVLPFLREQVARLVN
jgi:uracil-DNA glycosylase